MLPLLYGAGSVAQDVLDFVDPLIGTVDGGEKSFEYLDMRIYQ